MHITLTSHAGSRWTQLLACFTRGDSSTFCIGRARSGPVARNQCICIYVLLPVPKGCQLANLPSDSPSLHLPQGLRPAGLGTKDFRDVGLGHLAS